MGQQQLLLVILVTIIVGIATVVAINTFSSASDSANVDAARQDILSMASTAQGWYMKPAMMGGGGQDFTNTNGDQIEIDDICQGTVDGTDCVTENGTYSIQSRSTDEFEIQGTPSTAGGTLTAFIVPDNILQTSGGSEGIAYTAGS
ncbi:hypothetical protein [Fodinibius sp. Rm-B-1B1-1]|uniref:hypothetical protein n=1 Tax=Fodinibius alkaliphilus TaxID=3140241 RepID=UPI003159DCBC